MTKAEEDHHQLLKLEPKQTKYDHTLAESRYAACDPDNRLIASMAENRWVVALSPVQVFKERMAGSLETHEADLLPETSLS